MYANRFRTAAVAVTGAVMLLVTAACGGASSSTPAAGDSSAAGASSASGSTAGGGEITLLYAPSGPAETAAIEEAATAFSTASGTAVTVTAAQDLAQQLAQGFALGQSPDVFYVTGDQFATYADAGNLLPYGDSLSNVDDFYPALKTQFSYDGKLYCASKDMSTLALFINTDMWTAAGLTDADIPTTWDQLSTVAKTLTTPTAAGLSVAPTRDRMNAFLAQNGSFLVSEDGKTVTADDPKNVEALQYLKTLHDDGSLKFPAELGAGWPGRPSARARPR